MATPFVEIHEFSTGIIPQRLTDGSWVSCGFTGQYMNSTLSSIPYPIERSIANKEFAVSEGASSNYPAIIGRIVESWHTVALVTKGRDEKGRGASFYRYFLTQAEDGLSLILSFLNDHKEKGLQVTFNPFEHVIEPHRFLPEVSKSNDEGYASDGMMRDYQPELPELLDPSQGYKLEQVNERAIAYSRPFSQATAWAFNVEALEKPNRFQVILPANETAARNIRQSLSTAPPVSIASQEIDEQAAKTAIKNLLNTSQPKPESFQTLVSMMDEIESKLDNKKGRGFWNTLFASQGVNNAIQQKIYSQSMVRLLTIRAIILPETLPDFWNWLEKAANSKQQRELKDTSLGIQGEAVKYVNNIDLSSSLKSALLRGVSIITISIFEDNISPEFSKWLLNSPRSIWREVMPQHIKNIKHDAAILLSNSQRLNPISQTTELQTTPKWQGIIKGLQYNKAPKRTPNAKNHLALGALFSSVHEPLLAACFYQAGAGVVPSDIYQKAEIDPDFNHGRPYRSSYLRRKITITERASLFLKSPFFIGFIVMLLLFGIIKFSVKFLRGSNTSKIQATSEITNQPKQLDGKEVEVKHDTSTDLIQGTELLQAVIENPEKFNSQTRNDVQSLIELKSEKFDSQTHDAIQSLVKEATLNPKNGISQSNKNSLQKIVDILLGRQAKKFELELLSYNSILQEKPPKMSAKVRRQWQALVYKYQDSKKNLATDKRLKKDGRLTKNGDTYKALLEDIKKSRTIPQEEREKSLSKITPPPNHRR